MKQLNCIFNLRPVFLCQEVCHKLRRPEVEATALLDTLGPWCHQNGK